jgi:hypothetical protein
VLTFVDNLARRLVRQGLRRGLLEGNPAWVAVLAFALLFRLVSRPQRPRVITEQLRVGETLTVTHRPGPSRRAGEQSSAE